MKNKGWNWGTFFFTAACAVGCVAVMRDTYFNGWDFEVFWNAARAAANGQSPYTFGIENGWSYKYPPWALFIFLPFAPFTLATGKIIWGVVQILSVAITYRWLMRVGIRRNIARWTLGAFWFLIHYHALSGQVTLVTLAIATLAYDGLVNAKTLTGSIKVFAVLWAFSLKVFSTVTLIGLWEKKLAPRTLTNAGIAALLFAVVSTPQYLMARQTPAESVKQWRSAASTSATSTDTVVRMWNNQGIPGAIGRAFHVDGKNLTFDVLVSIVVMILLSVLWYRSTRGARFELRWAGWLAIGVIAHPLVWFQSFVLVWPLAAFAVQNAWDSREKQNLGITLFGLACVTMITKSGGAWLGIEDFVLGLEELSIKSIGTLILLYTAATAAKGRPKTAI